MSDGQHYMTGFGNHFATEARAGALPVGQNSPQLVPFGLYAEQWSGTAFTAPRSQNLRTWFYRQMPSAAHAPFRPYNGAKQWHNPPYSHATPPAPNRLRWSPPGMPEERIDFVDSLCNLVGNGDLAAQTGIALHLYATNASMDKRPFSMPMPKCSSCHKMVTSKWLPNAELSTPPPYRSSSSRAG